MSCTNLMSLFTMLTQSTKHFCYNPIVKYNCSINLKSSIARALKANSVQPAIEIIDLQSKGQCVTQDNEYYLYCT